MIRREYPERPLVGVGGVVVDGERVLLVRRARAPLKGEWSLPGGLVEVGESLAAAVRREIAEETGLQVRVGKIIKVLDRITRDAERRVRYHYVLVDFLCQVERDTASTKAPAGSEEPPALHPAPKLHPADDVSDARWVRRRDLAKYELRPATLRVIEKAFQSEPRAPASGP